VLQFNNVKAGLKTAAVRRGPFMLVSRYALRGTFLSGLLCLLVVVSGFASERKKELKSPANQTASQPQGQSPAEHLSVTVETPKTAQPEPVAAPAPPPPPLTLAQKPAVPPQVQYQNGQLTITAENSTLGDILRAVQKQTGTAIEIPGNATERVVLHVGPAATHDVLVTLLDGSSFNYVIVGSPTDPNAVTRVVLSPKPAGGAEVASTAGPGQPPPMPAGPAQPFAGRSRAMEDGPPEAQADADNNDDDDTPQPADQMQPEPQSSDADNQQPGAPGMVKTPQQMLEELQRQQQLQQQMQQGIQGATPIGGPPRPPSSQQE